MSISVSITAVEGNRTDSKSFLEASKEITNLSHFIPTLKPLSLQIRNYYCYLEHCQVQCLLILLAKFLAKEKISFLAFPINGFKVKPYN